MATTLREKDTKKPTEQSYESGRLERAHEEEMKLMVFDEQMLVTGDSGNGHAVKTDGMEAVACSCPDWDTRQPIGGCKHMIAWAEWTFETVAFNDTGEVIDLES